MSKTDASRGNSQLEHLAQVRALSQAIASAIAAIENNDLQKFETDLGNQETICHRLSAITMLSSAATGTHDAGARRASQIPKEVVEAHIALAQLNRVYAALLKRVSRSVALIAALYRSHTEGYDRGPSPSAPCNSWSCEV